MLELARTPQAACSDLRAVRQIIKAKSITGNQTIPWIYTHRHCSVHQSVLERMRHILHTVNGDIDLLIQQCLLNFLDK